MATINPVIVPGKALKGGRHKVRISVAHNGEFRYILTDIVIDSTKEFRGGQIVKRNDAAYLNTKLRGILQKYQETIDSIDYIDGLTCPEVVYIIKNGSKDRLRTLSQVFEDYLTYSKAKESSKTTYRTYFRILCAFLGEDFLLERTSHINVLALDNYLTKKKCSPATIRSAIALFAAILNYATRCRYIDLKTDPFLGYKRPDCAPRDSWLTVDQIKLIRDYQSKSKSRILARDIFMLSYYLGGINMADMAHYNFDGTPGVMQYIRQKTNRRGKINKFVEFDIPEEASEILDRVKGPDGRIAMKDTTRKDLMRNSLSHHLRNIAKELNIPNLIYYSARKSFAQHAYNLGIDTATIDYILGHSIGRGCKSLYSYVSVPPEIATKAIRRVLDNLKGD